MAEKVEPQKVKVDAKIFTNIGGQVKEKKLKDEPGEVLREENGKLFVQTKHGIVLVEKSKVKTV